MDTNKKENEIVSESDANVREKLLRIYGIVDEIRELEYHGIADLLDRAVSVCWTSRGFEKGSA